MRNYFVREYLSISVERLSTDNQLRLSISSDYSGSNRKSQLYVNEKRLADDIESLWKSIKTKKLLKLSVGFGEIDYYDNMTDMYEVPYASIERGLKKARIGYSTHGSIPKEWSCDLAMRFADTSANTPIMEAIKKTLGSTFTPEIEKEFAKKLKKVLQKKERYASYHYQSDDND
jgi:hypothetical protein